MVQNKLGFRYDINALRAIAVIAVILFHYKVPFFEGGFTGVDIFFVISGYLMSRIIINGLDKGKFSFVDFYSKRVKRIVPALLFLVLIITIICFFIYLPADFQSNQKNALSSILFLSNFYYWKHSNYFDPASDVNLFLHTWSLSVEWQFYIIYPVILLVCTRLIRNRSKYLWFHIGLTVIIFLASVFVTLKSPTTSFYILPTRSWEMLFGGIIFLLSEVIKSPSIKKIIAGFGYLGLFSCIFFLNSTLPWPGFFTLLPVLATGLVIIADSNDFYMLKTGIVQYFGKISYSLYLWHWPVYVIAQYMTLEMNYQSIIVLMLISLVLGIVSYKYIESLDFKTNTPVYACALILCVGAAAFSFTNSNAVMFKKTTIQIANYPLTHEKERKLQFSEGCCFVTTANTGMADFKKEKCLKIEADKRNILLIGDSHAAQFSASLRDAFNGTNINLLQANASGCSPIIRKNGVIRCSEVMDFIYNKFVVENSTKIDGVIICANWVDCDATNRQELLQDIQATIQYLRKYGISTVLIGQNETYTMPYPTILARDYQYNTKLSFKSLNKNAYSINTYLAKNLAPYYIDIINTDKFPGLDMNNNPYMMDRNHFTKYGADLACLKILSNPITKSILQ